MKLKTKLSTLLLGITSIFALTAAIVTNPNSGNAIEAKAESQTYKHVFTAKPSTGDNVTLSGVSWNISATNLNDYNSQYYAGVQFGTSKKSGQITLTSSTKWDYGNGCTQISEVRLWLNTGGSSVTPTVTIGGVAATSDGTAVVKNSSAGSNYSKATKVTFTPKTTNTGVVVIDVTSVKAGYICAIEIDAIASTTTSATLQSISAKSTQTKVYQNEKLDESAITVTGHYDVGPDKVLSSGWTVKCDTSVVATGVTATVTHTETNKKATFTVDVVEMPSNKTLHLVTSISELSTGDKIVMVGQKDGKYHANGALGSNDYLSSIDVTTAINNSIILLDDFELLTVVKTASSYKFVFEDGALLSVTAAKKLTNKGTGNAEFTIAINTEDNKATIQSKNEAFGRFLYNATTPRFTTYTSDTSASMLLPYIYKLNDGNNAGKYADEFLSTVTCDGQGSITAAEGFWNTESTKFDALSAADKKVFSLAEASESGSVEKCVNRYDAIVSKYGTTVYSDFMSRGIVSPSRAIFKPNIVEDAPITEIIVIASISAVTLIGLFAISKKRKEN